MPQRPLLTPEEERRLIKLSQAGDQEALDRLVWHNKGLVFKFVLPYVEHRPIDSGVLSYEDFLQEGHIGLIAAIRKFDLKRKVRLSTYAGWYIKKYVWALLASKVKLLYVPRNLSERLFSAFKKAEEYQKKYNDKPSLTQIAKWTKRCTAEQISSILGFWDNYASLSAHEVKNLVNHTSVRNKNEQFTKTVWDMLEKSGLSVDELELLSRYFGMGVYEPHKYIELAKVYNIPDYTAAKRVTVALGKLKYFLEKNNLSLNDFMEDLI
jgi:RNA polymerase sigma factor (sigma-70 family)